MAKRFTDTNKYKDPFIRGLQGAYKLLWDYLYHDCNHAGIWIVDFDIASIYLGSDIKVNRQDALLFFNAEKQRVVELDGGRKWLILPFIRIQYGELDPKNRVHKSVMDELSRLGYEIKPLVRPLQGCKDKDKDKDKEMDKDVEEEKGVEGEKNEEEEDQSPAKTKTTPLILPFSSENFRLTWDEWIAYRKERRLPPYKPIGLQKHFRQIIQLSNGDESTAIAIYQQSMSQNYQGIFALKTKSHETRHASDWKPDPESDRGKNGNDIIHEYRRKSGLID